MVWIRAVEPMVPVAAARDQVGRLKLRQFVLHRLKGEKAQPRQLTHVELLPRIGKQELQESARTTGNNPCKSVLPIPKLYNSTA